MDGLKGGVRLVDVVLSAEDRQHLRDLAKRQRELAALPVMTERRKLWFEHNKGCGGQPVVQVDLPPITRREVFPPLQCSSPAGQAVEMQLRFAIFSHEVIGDDKVVPDFFLVPLKVERRPSLDVPIQRAADSAGRDYGYHWDPPIKDLQAELDKLQPSTYSVDREATEAERQFIGDLFGDILPPVVKNRTPGAMLGRSALELLGMENMLFSMVDYPEAFHQLMRFLRDDLLAFLRWQEEEGLLTLNNDNDYAGAGSYGFTDELPVSGHQGKTRLSDLWMWMNSQETVTISPSMYGEFIAPYYRDVAKELGLVYYGCCEPVNGIWEPYLKQLPNLRKLSISAWCNEESIGDALRGTRVIYCRKPSPNFLAFGTTFDEEAYRDHIRATIGAARGCTLEISLRDICTVNGQPERLTQAVRIIREEMADFY